MRKAKTVYAQSRKIIRSFMGKHDKKLAVIKASEHNSAMA